MLHAARAHVERDDQDQEPEQGKQREAINNARAGQLARRNTARKHPHQRQRVEDAAERRAGGVGELEDGPAPCDRVDEMLFRNQMRDQRGAGRPGERPSRADEKKHAVNGEHAPRARQRERQQAAGAKHLERIADQDHHAPIEAVGHVTGGQQKEQPGKKQRQAGVAQVQRAMGHGVNLPRHGYCLRLRAQDHHHACELVAAEVARREGLQAAPGQWLRGRHPLSGYRMSSPAWN